MSTLSTASTTRNGRVGLLAQLKEAGVEMAGEPTDDFNGKFAWVIDPDGNKVELWEPKASDEAGKDA